MKPGGSLIFIIPGTSGSLNLTMVSAMNAMKNQEESHIA
jgi:hypothetical protein